MPPDERLNLGASKPPTALVALSLLVSVLAALFSLRSYSIATPPRFDSGWIVSWIVAGGSSAFALAVSKRAGIGGRIILGFAAILSLVAFGVPTMCYFENFMDMPPLAVFPFALLHAVIGWKSNQKIIGLLPLALGTAMFFGARQPGVPLVRQQQGDLVLESFSADSDGNTFHLSSASGKTIRGGIRLESGSDRPAEYRTPAPAFKRAVVFAVPSRCRRGACGTESNHADTKLGAQLERESDHSYVS